MKSFLIKLFWFNLLIVSLCVLEGTNPKIIFAAGNDEVHYTVTGSTSGTTGVVIDWRGPDSSLQYGTSTAYGQSVTGVAPSILPYSSSGPFWEAAINGLSPNTVYHYKIGVSSPDYTFKTAPTIGSSGFKVDAIADVGDTATYANVAKVASLIKSDNPDLVLIPGDLSYANAHGQQAADNHFNDEMVWSANSLNYASAYMPAWGNHEWDSSGDNLKNYKGRFWLPNAQTSSGSPSVSCCSEDWYWFDYGNVRFIAYPEPWSGAWSDWKTKVGTIMDAAQADSNIKFIITFGHRPAFSSGHHPGDNTLAGYMASLNSTHNKYVLNLNGHSHNYERTFPQNGVTHITVGTGGASLEQDSGGTACNNIWLGCPAPSYTAKRYMRQGVLSLNFSSTGIQGNFLCGPTGGGTNDVTCNQGDVIDSFSIGTPTSTNPPNPTATPHSTPSTKPGDANGDNKVDSADYAIWLSRYNQNVSGVTNGDFNGNGKVDGVDYVIWLINYTGTIAASTPTPTTPPVSGGGGLIPNLITDPLTIFTIPSIPKPAYLTPFTDPTFHTKLTRIAGNSGSSVSTIGSSWSADARHHYQKDQPWSIDGKYIALDTMGGLILDGTTYLPIKICSGGSDARWYSGTDPTRLHNRISINGTTIKETNVDSCSVVKTINLPINASYFGQSEGNASFDGNFAVANNTTQMVVVNLNTGVVGPIKNITDCGMSSGCSTDWASISASGKYAVVSYNGDHPRVYNINPSNLALTARAMPTASVQCSGHNPSLGNIYDLGHADMTLNPFDNNEDVIIGQIRSWCPTTANGVSLGQVVMVRLSDGKVTTLTKPGNEVQAHHISTRNYNRPGWAYVGYYTGSGKRFSNEIIAVSLDGSGTVEHLAHTHSSGAPYRNEIHAVPSPDGLRVIFASGWDTNCASGCGTSSNPQDYVIDLRS